MSLSAKRESQMNTPRVVVVGGFDDLRSRQVRFLEEASGLGQVTVLLWLDAVLEKPTRQPPRLPLAERLCFLRALRYVSNVIAADRAAGVDVLAEVKAFRPELWVDKAAMANEARRAYCVQHGLEYRVLSAAQTAGFPEVPPRASVPGPLRQRDPAIGLRSARDTADVPGKTRGSK